ncbi:MAG: alpha/beta hydrolase [Tissierellia bacterium]|nr:alpha/beta hydrolase [Tissierellia bacterium]
MEFIYRGKKVYYEVHGKGDPLMMLNGIMMSTASWTPFLKDLTKSNQVILIDFLDQGQSDPYLENYNHQLHVDMLDAFINHLGLENISLFGISYGGEIAIQYALQHQEKVEKLLLFNTTASTSYWLEEVGNGWNHVSSDPLAYYYLTIPYIYSPMFYTEKREWIEERKKVLVEEIFANKEFIQRMKRLTNSSAHYNVEKDISKIKIPTLIVGCQYDFITPYKEQEKLHQELENSELIYIPNCGHASMYEKPELFLSLLLGYTNTNHTLTIKA